MKVWSKLHKLEFPSIYLELTVLEALRNRNSNQPASNILTIFDYLRDFFVNATVIDPSNSNNIISDDLYKYEKEAIAKKAGENRNALSWGDIIW